MVFNDSYHKKKAANTWRIIFNYRTSNPLMVKNELFFLFHGIPVWRFFTCFCQTINSAHYRIFFSRDENKRLTSWFCSNTIFILKLDENVLSNTIVQGCFCHVVQWKTHRIFNFWYNKTFDIIRHCSFRQSKAWCILNSLFVR